MDHKFSVGDFVYNDAAGQIGTVVAVNDDRDINNEPFVDVRALVEGESRPRSWLTKYLRLVIEPPLDDPDALQRWLDD